MDKINKKEGIEKLLLEAHDCLRFNTAKTTTSTRIFPQIPERPLLREERVDLIVSFFLSKLLSRVPVGFDQDYKTVGVTIIFLLLFLLLLLLLLLLSLQSICGQSRLPQVRWEVLLFNCEGFNTQNTKNNAT